MEEREAAVVGLNGKYRAVIRGASVQSHPVEGGPVGKQTAVRGASVIIPAGESVEERETAIVGPDGKYRAVSLGAAGVSHPVEGGPVGNQIAPRVASVISLTCKTVEEREAAVVGPDGKYRAVI